LVAERLRSIDRSKGVILDGYPASKEQGDHLTSLIAEFGFSKPIVLQLGLSDAEVRKRSAKNNSQDVEQGLKDYDAYDEHRWEPSGQPSVRHSCALRAVTIPCNSFLEERAGQRAPQHGPAVDICREALLLWTWRGES